VRRAYLAAALLAIGLVPLIGAVIVQATKESKQQPQLALTPPSPYRGGTPPRGIRLPSFALRSYRGNLVSTRELRRKVVLVTFLDTKCTEKCPIFASQIASALRLLPSRARRQVVALALSVDPRVDSPTSVRRFLRRRHALGLLDFLLGSSRQLRPLAGLPHRSRRRYRQCRHPLRRCPRLRPVRNLGLDLPRRCRSRSWQPGA
jgi:cytochrome oxidase Cu insertion factor (SCO1/SenC/PrrC family)